jgi:hypothetical protein
MVPAAPGVSPPTLTAIVDVAAAPASMFFSTAVKVMVSVVVRAVGLCLRLAMMRSGKGK